MNTPDVAFPAEGTFVDATGFCVRQNDFDLSDDALEHYPIERNRLIG